MLTEVVTMLAAVSAATIAWHHALRPDRPSPTHVASHDDVSVPSSSLSPASTSIIVRVLGSVIVERDGSPIALTPRMLELVAFLATHPKGVTDEQLRFALWPDRSPTPAALRNLLWQARQRLGVVDDELAIATADSEGRYRLAGFVECDLRLLETIDTPKGAHAALRSVTGRPFEARRGFEWAYAEGLVSWAEQRIVAAAELVAGDARRRRDYNAAIAALDTALRAAPTDERLFRHLLAIHGDTGDRVGVERVMRRLLATVDDDSVERLEPETVELYRRVGRGDVLTRRR